MTGFRGNESEEKALFFVPCVGCIEECQWHSEGTGLSTRAIGHPLPVTACARGGLSGAVTKCWKEEGSHPVFYILFSSPIHIIRNKSECQSYI